MTIRRAQEGAAQRAMRAMRDVFPGGLGGATPVADPFAPAVIPTAANPVGVQRDKQLVTGIANRFVLDKSGSPPGLDVGFGGGFDTIPWADADIVVNQGDLVSLSTGRVNVNTPGLYAATLSASFTFTGGPLSWARLRMQNPSGWPDVTQCVYQADEVPGLEVTLSGTFYVSGSDLPGWFITQFGYLAGGATVTSERFTFAVGLVTS